MKKKCYYARPINLYNTPAELRDVAMIEALGFECVNPNKAEFAAAYKAKGMETFEPVVKECDALAFRACPDGRITAGVATEIAWAKDKIVFELPCGIARRTMSVDETREYLRDCGLR